MNSRSRRRAESATISAEEVSKVIRNVRDYKNAAIENGYILPTHGANLINR